MMSQILDWAQFVGGSIATNHARARHEELQYLLPVADGRPVLADPVCGGIEDYVLAKLRETGANQDDPQSH
jgi:hypothetical protein